MRQESNLQNPRYPENTVLSTKSLFRFAYSTKVAFRSAKVANITNFHGVKDDNGGSRSRTWQSELMRLR